jgi:hypothetical protein
MLKKIRLVLPVILVMTVLATGAGIALADDSSAPRQTAVVSSVDSSIVSRLLALKDQATLDRALARLVANGTLTDQEAARIRAAWLSSHR